MADLRERIHLIDPFAGFDESPYTLDLQGWGSQAPIFEQVMSKMRPSRVIEVGSWKGASAIHMANLAKSLGIADFVLLCVDTWLGSPEHWMVRDNPDFMPSLRLRNGYPQLYWQFLANVVHAGHADCIVPFPISSDGAAQFLSARGIVFDAAYIDAGHQYRSVRADLEAFWPLVRVGGVMFGDDFLPAWHGVIRAVSEFAESKSGSQLHLAGEGKWLIPKMR
jgi:hypothetical protein